MASGTITSVLYSVDRPHVVAIVDILSLLIMILGCHVLIPPLGSVAPAILAFAINAAAMFILTISSLRHIENYPL